ncbi:LysR family transcriptional regulator (plasmid) [Cupriavidus metallidurans]|uniref:LysR family transcriptional regulator n=1 Tax=Cupriavidus metallidurans TaxID=119219 RepID=UPI003D752602
MKPVDSQPYPDWNLLSTWVAVVEAAAVSEAARRLGVSQATISQRVKQLEATLNTTLLDRTTRPARATLAGERLYQDAAGLLHQLAQMSENVRGEGRAKRNIVRIGCIDSFAASLGPTLFKGLSGASRQIRLWSGITPTLEAQFEARQLDIAITSGGRVQQEGVRSSLLFSEPYHVLLPFAFELGQPCSLSELCRRLPLIRYSARSHIGQQIERYLHDMGDIIEQTCEFDASDPVLSLVAAGMGFAISTPMCVWQSRHSAQGLRVLPLSHFRPRQSAYPALTRSFYMMHREDELGRLPLEAERIIQLAMRKQLAPQMAELLGLHIHEIWNEEPLRT